MFQEFRSRILRAVALVVVTPSFALVGVAAASAAETFTNDTLPGKVALAGGESATVVLTTPEGFVCTDWFVRTVGNKRAKVTVTPPSLEGCTNATPLTWTVTVDKDYFNKATVVVKLKVYNADGTAKVVESLVVKANAAGDPQTGAPASKPAKPPNSARPS